MNSKVANLTKLYVSVLYGRVYAFGINALVSVRENEKPCFSNSHWMEAFYNPLSRHNSSSLTMDLSLHCRLNIVLIHIVSCFMIPLTLCVLAGASQFNSWNFLLGFSVETAETNPVVALERTCLWSNSEQRHNCMLNVRQTF